MEEKGDLLAYWAVREEEKKGYKLFLAYVNTR